MGIRSIFEVVKPRVEIPVFNFVMCSRRPVSEDNMILSGLSPISSGLQVWLAKSTNQTTGDESLKLMNKDNHHIPSCDLAILGRIKPTIWRIRSSANPFSGTVRWSVLNPRETERRRNGCEMGPMTCAWSVTAVRASLYVVHHFG